MTITTTNNTLLEGVYFDDKFLDKREQWRKQRSNFKIPTQSKKNLELSLERGISITVVNNGSMESTNSIL